MPTGNRIERLTPSGKGADQLYRRSRDGRLKVGVLSGTGEHPNSTEGETIAEIAVANEFGTRRIPARPFLRTGIYENISDYKTIIRTLLLKIFKGQIGSEQALRILGIRAASDVQEKIKSISSPPNSPATVAVKGPSNPLIDTGALRQHISWARIE